MVNIKTYVAAHLADADKAIVDALNAELKKEREEALNADSLELVTKLKLDGVDPAKIEEAVKQLVGEITLFDEKDVTTARASISEESGTDDLRKKAAVRIDRVINGIAKKTITNEAQIISVFSA